MDKISREFDLDNTDYAETMANPKHACMPKYVVSEMTTHRLRKRHVVET
jgi:hypothetical protein